jgi:hypothetical protein
MSARRYRITAHTATDVLGGLAEPAGRVPPAMFCDDEGACYFDAGPHPLTRAIEQVLDRTGEEGWELVQVLFRPGQMAGFRKQPR